VSLPLARLSEDDLNSLHHATCHMTMTPMTTSLES